MCPIQNDNTSVNPYKNYYKLMRELKDKTQLRQQMVTVARQQGIKPAARIFHTTAKTVRKWLRRWRRIAEKSARRIESASQPRAHDH